jgi:IS30 family transposase
MKKKYSQLNPNQRYQIAALQKAGHSNCFIATQLSVHKSTIGRELKRNSTSKQKYNAAYAHQFASDRQKDKPRRCLFSNEMKSFVKVKMESEQWSPDQISGYCKANKMRMVSHETIYQHVYADMKNGGTLYTHLRTQQKRRKKRTHRKDKRGLILNRVSIHKRPAVVDEKQRFGDWEIDLIEGANHNSFALTLVERISQFALIFRTPNKQADTIQTKIINALAPYKELVHTITSDNGKEFAGHQYVAQKLHADYFFADPYSSWQRGLNEYTNKLYRQYLPKKSNLNNYDIQYFLTITNKLNNRPRKLLNYKTPLQVFIANFKPN